MSRITGVSKGAISKVRSRGPENSSLTQGLREYIRDDRVKRRPCPSLPHKMKEFSLSVHDQCGADQANWMPCLCPHGQKCLVAHGFHSRRAYAPEWLMTIAAAACWHMGTKTETINGPMCNLLVSRKSAFTNVLIEYDPGPSIVYCRRPVFVGSSFEAWLLTCGGGSDDQESVWDTGLYTLNDIQLLQNVLGMWGQRRSVQFTWSAAP